MFFEALRLDASFPKCFLHIFPPKKQDQYDETPFRDALKLENPESEINLQEGGLCKHLSPDQDWMPWEMDVPIPIKVLCFVVLLYMINR